MATRDLVQFLCTRGVAGAAGASAGAGAGAGDGDGTARASGARARASTSACSTKTAPLPLFDLKLHKALLSHLSNDQLAALVHVEQRDSIFVTGSAGSGKSAVITALKSLCDTCDVALMITAPTGIAAEQVGGKTLHSFAGLGIHVDEPASACVRRIKRRGAAALQAVRAVQILVIDEVSMVSAETMAQLLRVLDAVRGPSARPILVCVGDFLQLAPVRGEVLLNSAVWDALRLKTVLLRNNFRQATDAAFQRILHAVRYAELTPDVIKTLEDHTGAAVGGAVKPTRLTARVKEADAQNAEAMEALKGTVSTYRARIRARLCTPAATAAANNTTKAKKAPTRMVDIPEDKCCRVVKDEVDVCVPFELLGAAEDLAKSLTPPLVSLALGAEVVIVANIALLQVHNGSRGVVTACGAETVTIRLHASGRSVDVDMLARPQQVIADDGVQYELVSFSMPVACAWALTIHRAQGMSLDAAIIDLSSCFADGQAYVALSRCCTLRGCALAGFRPSAVRATPEIVAWYKALERQPPPSYDAIGDRAVKAS